MSCKYRLGYEQAILLAVCDVLYNKQRDLKENNAEIEDKTHEEDNDETVALSIIQVSAIWHFEREHPEGDPGPPTSLSLPPTSSEDLRLDVYLE
ncbi:hypothetical protein TNCV_1168371 [Trichonephila clavipes]|uniref:Uncharacterized protein n=1 Tax=Trichonephila clavipes TaxID=2585209 RepID=A0A8X6T8S9_TRICX|nr:hypothetical protein TNCV_1168371 [Trichonephila clavipes]